MNLSKTVAVFSLGIFILVFTVPVFAETLESNGLQLKKEKVTETKATIKNMIGKAVLLNQVKIESISGDSFANAVLTVSKDGKQYTVKADGNTKYHRRYGGKMENFSELKTGHILTVAGKWTDDAKITIQAKLIRDASVQLRFGVFVGKVTSVNSTGWVMDSVNRGAQTVTVVSSTQYVDRRNQPIAQKDISVGHTVRVRGLWDNQANTITESTKIKDFSLPAIIKPSTTPALE